MTEKKPTVKLRVIKDFEDGDLKFKEGQIIDVSEKHHTAYLKMGTCEYFTTEMRVNKNPPPSEEKWILEQEHKDDELRKKMWSEQEHKKSNKEKQRHRDELLSTERKIKQRAKGQNINQTDIRLYYKLLNHRGLKGYVFQVFYPTRKCSEVIEIQDADHLVSLCKQYNTKGLSCISVNPSRNGSIETKDVYAITNLPIDIDVYKERRINGKAIQKDLTVALNTAKEIKKYLEEKINLRVSILDYSGNGYHLTIPVYIELSNYEHFTKEIKPHLDALEKIVKSFNNDVVKIDPLTADIARRIKIPGTLNVKEGVSPKNYQQAKIIEHEKLELIFIEGNTTVLLALEERDIRKPTKNEVTIPREKQPMRYCFEKSHDNGDKWNGGEGHLFRVAAVRELINAGYTDNEIQAFFKTHDEKSGEPYDKEITKGQIDAARGKNIKNCRCKTIRQKTPLIKKYCENCDHRTSQKENQAERKEKNPEKESGKPQVPSISILLDDTKKITAWLYGKKGLKITQGNDVIIPYTKTKNTWYESEYYRRLVKNSVKEKFDLTEEKAQKITLDIAEQAGKKINDFLQKNEFIFDISEGSAEVLEEIDKMTILRCEDTNTYEIHINKETIKLTDAQLYDGPHEFCIQYLNRFLRKIIITDEEWDQCFLPYLLAEGHYEVTEKINSNAEIVVDKFIQYVKNKKVFDWKDITSRTGHADSIYLDQEYHALRISSVFIEKFFETSNILVKYKVTRGIFNTHIEKFNARDNISGKVDGAVETFRMFNPDAFGIKTSDIIKTEPTTQIQNTPDLTKFSSEEAA